MDNPVTNLPAIPTRVVIEKNEYEGYNYGVMLGVEEFIPAWKNGYGDRGPQEWCRRVTWVQL